MGVRRENAAVHAMQKRPAMIGMAFFKVPKSTALLNCSRRRTEVSCAVTARTTPKLMVGACMKTGETVVEAGVAVSTRREWHLDQMLTSYIR